MIMSNRSNLYWLLQVLGWSAYAGLVSFASFNSKGFNLNSSFLINVCFSFFSGIFFSHLMKKRFVSMGFLNKMDFTDLIKISFLILGVSFLYVVTTKTFSMALSMSIVQIEVLSFIINWVSYFMLFTFWLTLYYLFHLFEKNRHQELDNLSLKAFQMELELKNLRSQLNPHFLFNALNSIRALIEVDPKKSKEAVTLLSNLLRFSLTTSFDRLVTIENELKMVDSYLCLEKIRFEDRLIIKKEINEAFKSSYIPAFTIQTLVENAIKHGVSKLIEGGEILIRVDGDEKYLLIQVANSGVIATTKDLGIGLSNLQKRLKIEYQRNYNFSIYQSDLVYAEIRIPLNR